MVIRIIIGCDVAIKYYIYVKKPHLTWMDKKLAFFVGAPGTHTSFFNCNGFQMQSWVVQVEVGCKVINACRKCVITLALGSRPRQRGCKVTNQKGARESL
jgi:hypothetical protein